MFFIYFLLILLLLLLFFMILAMFNSIQRLLFTLKHWNTLKKKYWKSKQTWKRIKYCRHSGGVGRGIPGILVCGTKCGVKIISLSLFLRLLSRTHTDTDTCVRRAQATLHAFNVCLFCFFFFWFFVPLCRPGGLAIFIRNANRYGSLRLHWL